MINLCFLFFLFFLGGGKFLYWKFHLNKHPLLRKVNAPVAFVREYIYSRTCLSVAAWEGICPAFAPPHWRLCPPLFRRKMAQINHFRQFFWFMPPQQRILPPQSPTPLKNSAKVYFRSQILERASIGEYWNIFGVLVLSGNEIFMFFRTYWCYSEAYNTGMQKWSSIVQYSCTSIWDLKYTFSKNSGAATVANPLGTKCQF